MLAGNTYLSCFIHGETGICRSKICPRIIRILRIVKVMVISYIEIILRCFRITLEILVIVVTINAISIQVCINDITIPDITLADSLFRIELISGIRHGLQPFHIIFRTDHSVRRPSFRIYRTIGIKIVSIAFIYVQHIKFIDHVPFQNTLQVSC